MMPFGLKNAPHIYCQYMHKFLAHLLEKSVKTYMDDIVVASHTFEQYMKDVDWTLSAAEANDMHINPQKGHYFQVEMCLQQRLQRLLVLKRNTSEITTTA